MRIEAPFPVWKSGWICLLSVFLALQTSTAQAAPSVRPDYTIHPSALYLPFAENDQANMAVELLKTYWSEPGKNLLVLHHFPGRSGAYAWSLAEDQRADGYSLAVLSFPSFAMQGKLKDALFKPDKISPVCLFAYAPAALWVQEASPYSSIDEFIAFARASQGSVFIAGNGRYTDQHMATLRLSRSSGILFHYLPYMSTATAADAVRDGTAWACWGYAMPAQSMPGMRPLALAHPDRLGSLPDTPTFEEKGLALFSGQYLGIGMPHTEDEYGLELVSEKFLGPLQREEVRESLLAVGFIPMSTPSSEIQTFLDLLEKDLESFMNSYPQFTPR